MWNPEIELNRDPDARPPHEDVAGWARFYAGRFYETDQPFAEPTRWGLGVWRYDGDCQSCHFQACADLIEKLLLERA